MVDQELLGAPGFAITARAISEVSDLAIFSWAIHDGLQSSNWLANYSSMDIFFFAIFCPRIML